MIFERVRWKNFLSTGNVFTDVSLNTHKNTLIIGENGAGKSTVLDALCFGLFGKPFRNINKPQLINSINNKDSVVEVYFTIGKDSYKVVRGQKPNIFEIYQNGEMINQDSTTKDYQDYLERYILRRTMKSFCQIEILGSASFVAFMALPTPQRRIIIENLLELEVFSNMVAILKTKISENDLLEQKLADEKGFINQRISDRLSLQKKFEDNKKDHIGYLNSKVKELELEIKNYESDLVELESNIQNTIKMLDGHQKVKSNLTQAVSICHKLYTNRDTIDGELMFFTEHDTCPTCTQKIDEDFKNKTISDKKIKLVELEENIKKLEDHMERYSEEDKGFEKIKSILNDLKSEYNIKQTLINRAQDQIDDYETKIKMEKNNLVQETTEDFSTTDLENDLIENSKNRSKAIEKRKVLKVASTLLKDSGIKSKIISKYIPLINSTINKYLAAMDFFANFELDETFAETIKSRHRDKFSYASFSEGEKMRIDLAILFTWRYIAKMRNTSTSNLLIMDEVLDSSLDQSAKDALMRILEEESEGINTFVITHDTDNLGDTYDRTLRFTKEKNFSVMKTE